MLRVHRQELVDAVGLHIDQIDVGQVLTVGEAGVLQRDVQRAVGVAEEQETVQVGERYGAQVLVAVKCHRYYVVQLVVVVVAEVVDQLHSALMVLYEFIVRTGHDGVLYLVALYLFHFLDGVHLVGVGILGAIQGVLGDGSCTLIGEVFLQRSP